MNPAKVFDEISKAEEVAPPEAEAETGAEDPTGPEGAGPPDPQAPLAKPVAGARIRFTVKNEILHGPLLWPASLGLARINSKLVLDQEIRKKLIDNFGTDEPLRISTRVGFFGGGSTTFSGDGGQVKFEDGSGTLAYDDFDFTVGYSGSLDDFDVKGEIPRISGDDSRDSMRYELTGLTLVGKSERVKGDVYDADYRFLIDKVVLIDATTQEATVDGVHYIVKASTHEDFMDVSSKFGTGQVKHPALAEQQIELNEIHYDFTLRRLHTDTLARLMADIKAMYTKPVATMADVDAAVMAPFKTHGFALLKHDPEYVFDRVGIVTSDGEGVIKGVVRLKGLEESDIAHGFLAWLGKIEADFTFECAQKLIDKLPNGAAGAGVMVDQGFAKREGEMLVSHIEYKQGDLRINGKAQGIPGLGGPPPDAMGSEGVMAPDGMAPQPMSEE
jgi:uncharacterized protein YdgA (DUF945 family)